MSKLKVLTKNEAIRVGYFIASHLSKRRSCDNAVARFESEQDGRWKWTDFAIEAPGFSISASRWKHSDGRIRAASNDANGLLNFAIWAVQNYPNIDPAVTEWKAELRDREKVARTIEGPLTRSIFANFSQSKRFSLQRLIAEIADARMLAKVAA